MIRFSLLLLPVLTAFALPASAQRAIPSQPYDVSDAYGASVARSWPVVERDKGESFLRISFQTVGPFPATDVSPPYGLKLTMYTLFPEQGTAQAQWHIAGVLRAQPPVRTAAGIYEIEVRTINDQQSMAMDCFLADQTLRIDARQASITARASRPADMFDHVFFSEDIYVSRLSTTCAEDQDWALY